MLRLAVLYVEYDRNKYGDSLFILQSYLNKIAFCRITYIIIDNRNEGEHIEKIEESVYRIGGNNRDREFSGWQKGIETLQEMKIPYHVALFTNEAVFAPGKLYLEDYASLVLLLRAYLFNIVIGRIDTYGKNISACGYDVSKWICTNCFFMPRKVIDRLKNIVTIQGNAINSFIEEQYEESFSQKKLILEKTLTRQDCPEGAFYFETIFHHQRDVTLEVELNKSFVPKRIGRGQDERELGIIIDKCDVTNCPLERATLLSGWYLTGDSSYWISNKAKIFYPHVLPGKLQIQGHIVPEILHNEYHDEIKISISIVPQYFKENAPLTREYQELILTWLTKQWHSKIQINEQTWTLFRAKTKAMLNEVLLSARIKEQGGTIKQYGEKKYY